MSGWSSWGRGVGLCISEMLYKRFQRLMKGVDAFTRQIVRESLYEVAKRIGMGEYLYESR